MYSASVWLVMSLGEGALKEDGQLIAKLFGSVGKIWEADEKLFDAITGLRYVVCCKSWIPQFFKLAEHKILFFLLPPPNHFEAYFCWGYN